MSLSQDTVLRMESFAEKLPVYSKSKHIIIEKYTSKDTIGDDERAKCVVFRSDSQMPEAVKRSMPSDVWRIGLKYNAGLVDNKTGGRFGGFLISTIYIGEKFYDFLRSVFPDLVQVSPGGTIVRGTSISTIVPPPIGKLDPYTPYSWETSQLAELRRQRDEAMNKRFAEAEIPQLIDRLQRFLDTHEKEEVKVKLEEPKKEKKTNSKPTSKALASPSTKKKGTR